MKPNSILCPQEALSQLGIVPDTVIAARFNVSRIAARGWRVNRGIPASLPTEANKAELCYLFVKAWNKGSNLKKLTEVFGYKDPIRRAKSLSMDGWPIKHHNLWTQFQTAHHKTNRRPVKPVEFWDKAYLVDPSNDAIIQNKVRLRRCNLCRQWVAPVEPRYIRSQEMACAPCIERLRTSRNGI